LGTDGVGIYSHFSSPLIEDNTIDGNLVSGCSGGMGAGVYVGGNSTAEIVGNRITNGGVDVTGAGMTLFAAGRAMVVSNVIAGNSTRIGGVQRLRRRSGDLQFRRCPHRQQRDRENDAGTGVSLLDQPAAPHVLRQQPGA
jgi:hypothetical protein